MMMSGTTESAPMEAKSIMAGLVQIETKNFGLGCWAWETNANYPTTETLNPKPEI